MCRYSSYLDELRSFSTLVPRTSTFPLAVNPPRKPEPPFSSCASATLAPVTAVRSNTKNGRNPRDSHHALCFITSPHPRFSGVAPSSALALALKTQARGMVGPVDLRVAVRARPVEDETRRGTEGRGRVAGLDVAPLAQPRHPRLEQAGVHRAVGLVTVEAALTGGRVLPEKRAPFLRVAPVTVLVHRVLAEERRGGGAVRVVTVRAGQVPLAKRHVRGALELCPPLQMALKADLGFGPLLRKRALGPDAHELRAVGSPLHHPVAVRAGHAPGLVSAAGPVRPEALLVTLKTARVALLHRSRRVLPVAQDRRGVDGIAHVRASRPVAGLAGPFLQVVTRTPQKYLPHARLRELLHLLRVAGLAGLVPDIRGAGGRLALLR